MDKQLQTIERAIKKLESLIEVMDIRIKCGHGTPEIEQDKQSYQIAISALRNHTGDATKMAPLIKAKEAQNEH